MASAMAVSNGFQSKCVGRRCCSTLRHGGLEKQSPDYEWGLVWAFVKMGLSAHGQVLFVPSAFALEVLIGCHAVPADTCRWSPQNRKWLFRASELPGCTKVFLAPSVEGLFNCC